MRMSEKESNIILVIHEMMNAKKTTATLDEIGEQLYRADADAKPKHWKAALAATLRNLSSKVAKYGRGTKINRTSPLGRGAKGEYKFVGDFSQFLKSS
jgi:hypothetical protein